MRETVRRREIHGPGSVNGTHDSCRQRKRKGSSSWRVYRNFQQMQLVYSIVQIRYGRVTVHLELREMVQTRMQESKGNNKQIRSLKLMRLFYIRFPTQR